jgi:hypothetical protein
LLFWRLQHLRTASRERTDGRTGQAAKCAAQVRAAFSDRWCAIIAIKVSGARRLRKNTLPGFFSIELTGVGLPGKHYTKPGGGEQSWTNIVDFADNKSRYLFQDEALPLVLAAFAEVPE